MGRVEVFMSAWFWFGRQIFVLDGEIMGELIRVEMEMSGREEFHSW